MQRILFLIVYILVAHVAMQAVDPTATIYNNEECQGSLRPYPMPESAYDYPDTLTPVFINHVGRHGSRFPASATNCVTMRRALLHADSIGSITKLGREFLELTDYVIARSNNQWGALDSLGMAEHRGIASRMFSNFPQVLSGGNIKAISSYSPRCIMSMYSFTHQLSRLNNRLEIETVSGRDQSVLMRPFDVDQEYIEFRKDDEAMKPYDEYILQAIPLEPLRRILGESYPYDAIDARSLALVQYYVIAGMSAMQVECDASRYFSTEEYNRLWSCFNMRQYIQRTSTTISTIPADIASPLLLDIIATTDAVVEGRSSLKAVLRFGHAETMMPLLSLMRIDGCYYKTNYFDTVAKNWRDFDVVPMAANLQMILFRNSKGEYFVRFDRNEKPCAVLPGSDDVYVPWNVMREYLMRCVPIYYQL